MGTVRLPHLLESPQRGGSNASDFILDFGNLPFSLHLGIFFIHFGKKITKIHKIGKIKTIFCLGMTPL